MATANYVKTLYEYDVVGDFGFPLDMFRYDQCHPKRERDTARIEALGRRGAEGPTTVTVVGMKPPTDGRWRSFGWRVVGDVRKVKL